MSNIHITNVHNFFKRKRELTSDVKMLLIEFQWLLNIIFGDFMKINVYLKNKIPTKTNKKYFATNYTIDNEFYLKQLILYIHNNPVHHGFCNHPLEYPWSSYLDCILVKPTKLKRDEVIGLFDGVSNFKTKHNEKIETINIEKWLEL